MTLFNAKSSYTYNDNVLFENKVSGLSWLCYSVGLLEAGQPNGKLYLNYKIMPWHGNPFRITGRLCRIPPKWLGMQSFYVFFILA